jgi:hypothetical protein
LPHITNYEKHRLLGSYHLQGKDRPPRHHRRIPFRFRQPPTRSHPSHLGGLPDTSRRRCQAPTSSDPSCSSRSPSSHSPRIRRTHHGHISSHSSPRRCCRHRLHGAVPRRATHRIYSRSRYGKKSYEPAIPVTLTLKNLLPTLGLKFKEDPVTGLLFLWNIQEGAPACRIPRWKSQLRHSVLRAVDGEPPGTLQNLVSIISKARAAGHETLIFTFAQIETKATVTAGIATSAPP